MHSQNSDDVNCGHKLLFVCGFSHCIKNPCYPCTVVARCVNALQENDEAVISRSVPALETFTMVDNAVNFMYLHYRVLFFKWEMVWQL